MHFAAYKSVGESMEKPGKYWRNNVAGTVELIEACLAADVRDIVFSSSCSVYGTPEQVPVTETAPIAPESVYAETKAMVERILRWYGTTHGLRRSACATSTPPAPASTRRIGEDWTYSINLIPLAMKAVLLGDRRLQVFGDDYDTPDGTCIRDYIHVDDLADAHVKALDHLARGGDDRRGERRHRRRLVGARRHRRGHGRSAGSAGALRHRRPPRRRPGHHLRRPDLRRGRHSAGVPNYGLDEIVQTAYDWHRSQL